jgi:hypothetical protein
MRRLSETSPASHNNQDSSRFARQFLNKLGLSILLDVNCALVRERFEPKEPVVATHAALVYAAKRQLVFQVMREEPVDRHAAR